MGRNERGKWGGEREGGANGWRRAELALGVLGCSLLAAAFGSAAQRWAWQAEQERAFALRSAAAAPLPPVEEERRPRLAPLESGGPPAAPAVEPADPPAEPRAADDHHLPAPDPAVIGRLEIPRLRMRAIVRAGDDAKTLARAVGWIPGTAPPGAGGNTALAAHRDTLFRPLQRIEIGDRIRLVTPSAAHEYRVDSVRVVEPEEVSVLESSGIEELTLITCYPFRWIGPAPERFVVKARRIEPDAAGAARRAEEGELMP